MNYFIFNHELYYINSQHVPIKWCTRYTVKQKKQVYSIIQFVFNKYIPKSFLNFFFAYTISISYPQMKNIWKETQGVSSDYL